MMGSAEWDHVLISNRKSFPGDVILVSIYLRDLRDCLFFFFMYLFRERRNRFAPDQISTDVEVPHASDRLSSSNSARSPHVNRPPWPVLSPALEAEAGMIYNMDAPASCRNASKCLPLTSSSLAITPASGLSLNLQPAHQKTHVVMNSRASPDDTKYSCSISWCGGNSVPSTTASQLVRSF